MVDSPMDGGPDYIRVMSSWMNAKGNHQGITKTPPAGGGDQLSVRFSKDRIALFEILCSEMDWSKNQVLIALVDCGLTQFFRELDDEVGHAILEGLSEKLVGHSRHE